MEILSSILVQGKEFLLSCRNTEIMQQKFMKGERDYALSVDIELEKIYKKLLQHHFPYIPINGEELSPIIDDTQNEVFWTVDPIDGTVNYSKKLFDYGTSIALVLNGKPIISGISFPSINETYIAGKNVGTFLNGKRVSVSSTTQLSSSIVMFGDFFVGENRDAKNKYAFNLFEKLANSVLRMRMPGSAAIQLAHIAAGRSDISITLANNAWDVQGGVLLVREAGGYVFDFDGSEHNTDSRFTLATNNEVLKSELLKYFQNDLNL